jgi:Glycosyltransferase GT-D fold
VNAYPTVLGEMDTLERVINGASIARFGDGEIALSEGKSIRPQRAHPELAARLRSILRGDAWPCLVGIPNIVSRTPKAVFWEKYKRIAPELNPAHAYVSSFITRPDNAPWLDTPAYWEAIESLWADRDVTLVRGDNPNGTGAVSLLSSDLGSARSVTEVIAPGVNAWAEYDSILERIGAPARALLCLGATATVLAVDLSRRGVHAIDLGHIGMFIHKRAGLPVLKYAVAS